MRCRDQCKGIGQGLQDVVKQHAGDAPRLGAGIGQIGQEGLSRDATGRVQALQSGNKIRQEEDRVVIPFVQREPGHGKDGGWRMENGGQEGGFAVAGGRGEEGESPRGQTIA
jgi:hypothetical protein